MGPAPGVVLLGGVAPAGGGSIAVTSTATAEWATLRLLAITGCVATGDSDAGAGAIGAGAGGGGLVIRGGRVRVEEVQLVDCNASALQGGGSSGVGGGA